jgi:hypothetical protein
MSVELHILQITLPIVSVSDNYIYFISNINIVSF